MAMQIQAGEISGIICNQTRLKLLSASICENLRPN